MGRPKTEKKLVQVGTRIDPKYKKLIDYLLENKKDEVEIKSVSQYVRLATEWFTRILIENLAEKKEKEEWEKEAIKEKWTREIVETFGEGEA